MQIFLSAPVPPSGALRPADESTVSRAFLHIRSLVMSAVSCLLQSSCHSLPLTVLVWYPPSPRSALIWTFCQPLHLYFHLYFFCTLLERITPSIKARSKNRRLSSQFFRLNIFVSVSFCHSLFFSLTVVFTDTFPLFLLSFYLSLLFSALGIPLFSLSEYYYVVVLNVCLVAVNHKAARKPMVSNRGFKHTAHGPKQAR